MYARHRLEALSDGIFAVVMTLLVIDLKVPNDVSPGHVLDALRHERVAWIAFAITFGIAARYWVLQHRVFAVAERFHRSAVTATMVFLGLVTTLPFTTALMSRYGTDRIVLDLYCANQALIGAALILKLELIVRHNNVARTRDLSALRGRLWSLTLAMAAMGASAYVLPVRFAFFIPAVILLSVRRFFRETPPARAAA